MKTVGSVLKKEREKRGYSIARVERATKIKAKFLEAIEADEYHRLPSIAYAKGFVKIYGKYLGLSENELMAFFRRQTKEAPKSTLLPKGMSKSLSMPLFRLTPGKFLALLLIGLVGIFAAYLSFQYNALQQAPNIIITSPEQNMILETPRVDVMGSTDPDATVTVQGVSVLVRSDGQFFEQVTLESGVNEIEITATSRLGKSTTIIREVGLEQ